MHTENFQKIEFVFNSSELENCKYCTILYEYDEDDRFYIAYFFLVDLRTKLKW